MSKDKHCTVKWKVAGKKKEISLNIKGKESVITMGSDTQALQVKGARFQEAEEGATVNGITLPKGFPKGAIIFHEKNPTCGYINIGGRWIWR